MQLVPIAAIYLLCFELRGIQGRALFYLSIANIVEISCFIIREEF